jgi:chemotaxis methyl-accepting protein methylase
VKWRRLNLVEAAGGVGAFDLILCRGYFAALLPGAQEKAAGNLAAALKPGGRLILGPRDNLPASAGLIAVTGAPGVFEAPESVRAAA